MAEQTRPDDPYTPNQAANKEKAEGSRQDADAGDNASSDAAGGISNRPLAEQSRQQLPPRGGSKEGGHA